MVESITFHQQADAAATAVFALSGIAGTPPTVKPVALTGWNVDVVTEIDTGSRYSDGIGGTEGWFESGLDGHLNGLPATAFASAAANTVVGGNSVFQFEPFNALNALRLGTHDTEVYPDSGELLLVDPGRYTSIAVLATSAWGGTGQGMLEMRFADGTFSDLIPYDARDWYAPSAPENAAVVAARNSDIGADGTGFSWDNRSFALFETDIDLVALGLDDKVLEGITFYKSDLAGASTSVMAVSGERLPDIPPGTITITQGPNSTLQAAGEPSTDTITIVVDPPAPEGGLDILLESSDEFVVTAVPAHLDAGGTETTSVVSAVGVGTADVTANADGYDPSSAITYTVEVVAVDGDVDGDGCVNVADLLTVRNNLGQTGSEIFPPSADVTGGDDGGDDIVNVADLLFVRNRLGDGPGCAE